MLVLITRAETVPSIAVQVTGLSHYPVWGVIFGATPRIDPRRAPTMPTCGGDAGHHQSDVSKVGAQTTYGTPHIAIDLHR